MTEKLTIKNAQCWQMTSAHIEEHWDSVKGLVQRIVEGAAGEFNLSDIQGFVEKDLMQVFIVHLAGEVKAIAVSELVQYPRFKVVRLVGIAGENPLVFGKFWQSMEVWAKANGATQVETFATEKSKALDIRMGMGQVYSVMRKRIV